MQNEILELTQKLIGFKTVTGNNKEIAACFDFIKKYFEPEVKQGKIIVKEYEKDGVLSLVLANSISLKLDVILNGHVDVVNAENKEFIPKIKGSKLFGRGSGDMKSQVAIMMIVLKELVNAGFKKTIALMFVSDEEIGGGNGAGYLVNEVGYRAKIGIIPDGGENFELNVKEKGLLWFKIAAQGIPAHGSRTWLGENAILKLMRFYKELEKNFPPLKKIKSAYQDGISVNLGKIQGGKSVNAVPDSAEMYIDFRYSEKGDKKKIIGKIKALAKKHKLEFEIIQDADICTTDPQNSYLKNFKNIAEKIIGRKMKIAKTTGASDARFLSQKGAPIIITSPNFGNIHASGEWVDIKDVEKLYKILKEFLINIK